MVFLRSKIIVIGDNGVGKSAICQMLGSDGSVFPKNYNYTVMSDLIVKQVQLPDTDDTVEFFLTDSSGKAMYFDHTKDTWLNADMFCIVYDITNKESLKHFNFWLDKVKETFENNKKMIGVLLGNKTDLERRRAVPVSTAKQLAETNNLKYFECSAKDYNGLIEPFKYLAAKYCERYNERIESIKSLAE